MDALAFIDLAQSLSVAGSECEWRTAVSRSYYGLFHIVAEFLDAHQVGIPKNAGGHMEAYRSLNECKVEALRSVARVLNKLRTDRNSADYDLADRGFSDNRLAQASFATAKRACDGFLLIVCDPKKAADVVRGVKEYRSKIAGGRTGAV